jgi:hypothetical protein
MLRSRKQRDRKESPARPSRASYLAFLVRIQLSDPSAFEMPDAPANQAGVFYFRVRFAGSPLMALSRQFSCISVCPLLDQSGERRILARDGLSANDPKRTSRWLHHSAAPRLRDAKRQADNLTKSGPMPESEWIGLAKRLPDRGIACGRSNDKKCRRNLENNRSWDDRMRRLLCVQEQPTVACVQPEACVQMP